MLINRLVGADMHLVPKTAKYTDILPHMERLAKKIELVFLTIMCQVL